MNVPLTIYIAEGAVLTLFFILFCVTSFAEKKFRAAMLGILFLSVFSGIWAAGYVMINPASHSMTIVASAATVPVLLYFLPVGRRKLLNISNSSETVDERDTMFARADYLPGTEKYDMYYSMRPKHRQVDDRIRRLPDLLEPGGRYYDRGRSGYVASLFALEESHTALVDGKVNDEKADVDAVEMSRTVKAFSRHLGAAEVGIARLNRNYVYSNVGRGPEPWGSEISNTNEFVIAFTVEMNFEKVEEAPGIGITEESANQYINAQKISIPLARYLRGLGYPARAHISGSNYQVMLPPVAHDAGLGELGRHGYLISQKYGSRVRLGAVTTDIPLIPDKPVAFGVQDFCEKCKKCAVNCPSGSIPRGDKTIVRGVEKWQLQIEKCYQYWRIIGTDCGICMKVCPFSHPDTAVHNVLRYGIKQSSFARTISVYGDDLFYGKKFSYPRFRENG